VDIPREITFGGNGKGVHAPNFCPTCRNGTSFGGGMHPIFQVPPENIESAAYDIPWLVETEEKILRDHTSVQDI
jgi:hypothetical protein